MKTISLVAALAAAAAATPAFAQEAAPFTGPHVEALIGYDRLSAPNDGSDEGLDGLQYGIGAGYDFQLGGAVVGIEGEFSDSTSKFEDAQADFERVRAGRDLYVGARVGVALSPTALLYAKGGYTNARVNFNYNDGVNTANDGITLDGYRVGAGIEGKFSLFGPSGFIKAEYRYSNYSNADIGNFDADIDLDRHQGVVGIGVRF